MFLLFYGKDTYRSFREFKKLKKDIEQKKQEFDLLFFDFSLKEENLSFLKKELFQDSIFNKKKAFFIKEFFNIGKTESEVIKFFKNSNNLDKSIFVFWEKEVDKKNQLFKIVSEKGNVNLFELLQGESLKKWISDEIKNKGGEIEKEALNKLSASTGNDLWMASNEIDKLIIYRKKEKIKEKDVDFLTISKIEGDIFKAIDFLAARKRKQALEIFYKHIKKGDHVLYLITMITFQFRNLILVKMSGQNNAKELEMHPFVFQKSLRQAMFFSEEELKRIYKKILKAETDIKTGKATPEVALSLLITEIK